MNYSNSLINKQINKPNKQLSKRMFFFYNICLYYVFLTQTYTLALCSGDAILKLLGAEATI